MAKVKARVKVPKTAEVGELVEIKTLISHPMHSGRAVDSDGKIVPRKIINSFTAKFNGNTVFEVNMRPSVSSDSSAVVGQGDGSRRGSVTGKESKRNSLPINPPININFSKKKK